MTSCMIILEGLDNKKPAGMKLASYDHDITDLKGHRSYLVGIPCRLKDPPVEL